MAELVDESAVAQLQALSQGRITARALLEAHLTRHQAVHGKLNAVVRTDLPRARARADAVDAARAAGQPLGALAGLPMTVKDGFDVDGMPARAGAPQLASRPAACAEGPLVTRLRAAGAVLWGKTNVPYLLSDCQSFNPLDGTTNNPFDVTRTPGGSSGGAAAALAAGVTPLELGSDIGGSLRNPASFCGVLALKPTQGRLSMEGHVPPLPGLPAETDLVVPGPMARTAADLRLLWEVLAGEATPRGEVRGLEVAVWPDEPRWPRSGEAVQALETVANALEGLGLTVTAAKPEVDAVELTRLYQVLLDPRVARYLPPATRTMAWLLRPLAGLLAGTSDDLWSVWRSVAVLDGPPEGVAAAERRRDELKGELERFFGRFDVLLMPNAPLVAFPHDRSELILRKLTMGGRKVAYVNFLNWILPATALHLPALSLPSGLMPGGLPIGVQLVAPWGAEARLLDLAQALEPKLGGFRAPPLDRLRA